MTEVDRIKYALTNVILLVKHSDYYNHNRDHADIDLIESIVMKEIPNKPFLHVCNGYDDDEVVYDEWVCPCCGKHYHVNFDKYNYCHKCGQRIDWKGHEDLLNQIYQK